MGDGTIVLPAAPSEKAHLEHYLGRPEVWHKVDGVGHRDPNAPGGWTCEAHLLCLVEPYVLESTTARRAAAATTTAGRRAGGDVNVSNVTIVSHSDGRDFTVTTIERTADDRAREQRRRVRERRRHKALDRSRRNTNPDQYHPS